MGGRAFIISGRDTGALLQPRPLNKSISDHLFRRQRFSSPIYREIGGKRTRRQLIEISAPQLVEFESEYREYLRQKLNPPWQSSTRILDYLNVGVVSTYLRGEKADDRPSEWYLQVTFSGCAGQAEVSADLASHWAEIWFQENKERLIAKYLAPLGFEPNADRGTEDASRFVPLGEFGYGAISRDPSEPSLIGMTSSRFFDIDVSWLEAASSDRLEALVKRLDAELPSRLSSELCYCQLCSPTIDPAPFEMFGRE